MAARTGSARWIGDFKSGTGEVMVGEHTWTTMYSSASRFNGVLPDFQQEDGTNPEELLAAAHAACFTHALSLALTEAGNPPRSIQTRANVHLRFLEGAPRIQEIDLETEGDIPGLDEPEFKERAEWAKRTCIISQALSGVDAINLVTRLADEAATRAAKMLERASVATRLPAQDLARARSFYAQKLGLEPVEERPGGLRYRCGSGEFTLFESAGASSASHTQMAWEVDDLDRAVAQLTENGVTFEEYDVAGLRTHEGIAQVAGNYPSKGGIGERAAWFKDSEGNLLAIGQPLRR